MNVLERVRIARREGDLASFLAAVPFMAAMGMRMSPRGDEVVGELPFAPAWIGNYTIEALHGGTLGALLESTAIVQLLWTRDREVLPRLVNITLQYLRTGRAVDTFARAEILKEGRRVAVVRAEAWQEDPARPIASAQMHFLLR